MAVTFSLLGQPICFVGDRQLRPSLARPFLLYCYLVFQADWVPRDQVLALFWPDSREAKARQNLRALLYQCKKEPYADALEVTETSLRCLAATDVQHFQEAISNGNWQEAVEAYGGAFLAPVGKDLTHAFEDWLYSTRDALHLSWHDAALHVADELAARHQHTEAISLLQNVLSYDVLAEGVVHLCMRLQAQAGYTLEALKVYDAFRAQLSQDLEIEPLKATQDLARAIREGTYAPQEPPPAPSSSARVETSVLPRPLTPFVGRTLELLELANLLADPEQRLITLLGPGGSGKSRLALKLLETQAEAFPDGAAFVSLAPLASPEAIPDAVATAIGLRPSGDTPVREAVAAHLAPRRMLLVLDNVEHLLAGASFVAQLLTRAPGCRVVCTSRVLLGLAGESVYDVVGLSIPQRDSEKDIEGYDAARLFLRNARRVRSDFQLHERDYPVLAGICRYLDGMPLALELAATWLRLFPLRDLLGELQRDPGLLETSDQGGSERHRSMRQVFGYSWGLLSAEEQRVLAALSIFRGGFTLDAVSAVVGATPRTLLGLVNKSLLRTTPSGRYSILEVIRQYAAEQLSEAAGVQAEHGRYYLNLLADSISEIRGPQPAACFERLERDLENLRAAWYWAAQERQTALLHAALEPLDRFIVARSRSDEGLDFMRAAITQLDAHEDEQRRLLGRLYLRLSAYSSQLGQSGRGKTHVERALALLESSAASEDSLSALQSLTNLASDRGDHVQAVDLERRALDLAYSLGNDRLIAKTLGRLAVFENDLGNYASAQPHYEEAIARFRRQHNLIGMSYNLTNYGGLLLDTGKYAEAYRVLEEALPLVRQMGDSYYLPYALTIMGDCNYQRHDWAAARANYLEALHLAKNNHDPQAEASAMLCLGRVDLAEANRDPARLRFKQGLQQAWEINDLPSVLFALLAWGEYLTATEPATAAALFAFVAAHLNATRRERDRAAALRASLDVLSPAVESKDLGAWVSALLRQA